MPMKNRKRVRIRYWYWDTIDTGRWKISPAMTPGIAKKYIKAEIYERPTIIEREENEEGRRCQDD